VSGSIPISSANTRTLSVSYFKNFYLSRFAMVLPVFSLDEKEFSEKESSSSLIYLMLIDRLDTFG